MYSMTTPGRRLLLLALLAALTSCVTGNPTGTDSETTGKGKKTTATAKPKPSTSASSGASASPSAGTGTGSASPSVSPSGTTSSSPGASPSASTSPSASPSTAVVTVPGPNTEARVIFMAGIVASGFADGAKTDARFNEPGALAVDSANNIYVADTLNFKIRKIKAGVADSDASLVTTLAGDTEGVPFGPITALAFDNTTSTLYVAEATKISKVTSAGVVTVFAGGATSDYLDGNDVSAKFKAITSLAIDAAGDLFVGDGVKVRKVTKAGAVSTLAGADAAFADGKGTAAKFQAVNGVALDKTGNLYILDQHRLRYMVSDTTVTTLAGGAEAGYVNQSGDQVRFRSPKSLLVDPNGDVLIADTGNHCIRWARKGSIGIYEVQTVGNLETAGETGGYREAASYMARFNAPLGMVVLSDGVTAIADSKNYCIRKVDYYKK
jgi:hypothetical protein